MEDNKKNQIVWDADENKPEISQALREALRQIRDPEIGMDLIQLGLIRNVTITDDRVKIIMILTTPYCPYAPVLLESARKKAEEVSGITAEITYGSEVWDQSMMEDGSAISWGLF